MIVGHRRGVFQVRRFVSAIDRDAALASHIFDSPLKIGDMSANGAACKTALGIGEMNGARPALDSVCFVACGHKVQYEPRFAQCQVSRRGNILRGVPSVPERLATLEARVAQVAQRVQEIYDAVNGGNGVEWPQSIRGRLHAVEGLQAAAASLEKSAEDIRRARNRRLDTWAQVLLVCAAIVTAAAAITGAIAAL
jgi:hypothetical protein